MTFAGEDFGRNANGFSEVSGYFSQCREKEIAEAVPAELAVTAKAITEKTRHQLGVFGERDHAVADVAGGQHLQLLAQPSGAAAVVRDRNDRGETLDPHFLVILADKTFQTSE